MAKVLQVIAPFFIAEEGDKFNFNEDTKTYTLKKDEEFFKVAGDVQGEVKSSFSSAFSISIDYAKELIEEGYLEEYVEKKAVKKTEFVNVFNEISALIEKYETELSTINEDLKDEPECVRVEKVTVLNNLIKVLTYLKNLKK